MNAPAFLLGLGAAACALASCAGGTAALDLNGTWGHQRVFGIDSVCPETLSDGSVRNRECPDAGASSPEVAFPKYKPEFLDRVAALREGQVRFDTVLRCYPPGVPRIGPPAKIVQGDTEVVFLYDDPNGSFYRVIPLGQSRSPADRAPSYLGDSVGRFDGDALVVESSNFTEETWLTDNGAFHTSGLRVVETLRRVGDTVEYQATAHDPAVLLEPWVTPVRVLRRSSVDLEEPPRCEERDLGQMVDPSQFHENPR